MNKLKNSLKNKLSIEWLETLEKLDNFLEKKWFLVDSLELIWKWQINENAFQKFFNIFWEDITWLDILLDELTDNKISLANLVQDTTEKTKNMALNAIIVNSYIDGNNFWDE